MLKGFLAGTFVLVVIYVVVQPGASSKSEQASNALVNGLRRFLSPQVAGIGDHSKTSATGASNLSGDGASPDSAARGESTFGKLFTT